MPHEKDFPAYTEAEIALFYLHHVPRINANGDEWRGACPIHGGKHANFAVNPQSGLWYCHSKCQRGGNLVELAMALGDADFVTALAQVNSIVGRDTSQSVTDLGLPVASYPYTDENGALLFTVHRYEPKTFRQQAASGEWSMKNVRRVLYNLPAIINADLVVIVEGEKDVEALTTLGFAATCNPMGAGKWNDEYSDLLKGKDIVVIPDNDEPGQRHVQTVARSLSSTARSVRIAIVPAGKDISDWIGFGATKEAIQQAIDASTAIEDSTSGSASPARLPRGFKVTEDGIFYRDPDPDNEDPEMFICSRIEVVAVTRNSEGDEWGRLLEWHDPEGRKHEWAMPMSMLAGDSGEVRANLLDGGVDISTNRRARELFGRYIQGARPSKRMRSVSKVGWHDGNFVFPDGAIGSGQSEPVVFQSAGIEHQYNVLGTIEDWRSTVSLQCVGNSRLVLAVSAAFAAPLLHPLGAEPGGFHFRGGTSSGKTTTLHVAGSVWGGGPRGYVRSWRTTDNGLESTAAIHNDALLILDEMGQVDPKDVGKIAYMLANGQGKARMNKQITSRRSLNWRLLFLSSGEIKMSDHLATAGIRSKGGQEIRLLDIEANAGKGLGMFEDVHAHPDAGTFADTLKASSRKFYGVAAREFLRWLTANLDNAVAYVEKSVAAFIQQNVPDDAASEVRRAATRFGLVSAAGELASIIGITGWPQGEAERACVRCFKNWLSQRGTHGSIDTQEGINRVRSFLQANGTSRFQTMKPRFGTTSTERLYNRAGFRDEAKGETVYYILPDTFRNEICAGYDHKAVAKAMQQAGFLLCDGDRTMKKPRLPELGTVWVYAVRSTLLEAD
jgi:putative DNA primase/helicase